MVCKFTIKIYIHIVPKKEETSPTCIILLLCSLRPGYKYKAYAERVSADDGVNKQPSLQTTESNQPRKFEERKRSTAPLNAGNNFLCHNFFCILLVLTFYIGRPQYPRGLRRRSAAARFLRSWVRIPPGAWMFVCCECYVLSGRGLCDELITRPEESYRLWCVVECDQETSRMRRPWPPLGCSTTGGKKIFAADSIINNRVYV